MLSLRNIGVAVVATIGATAIFWCVAGDWDRAEFFGAGDAWQLAGPNLFFMDHRIHEGELPVWNPLILCGQPFAANPQSFLFYPPNLLRSMATFSPTPKRTQIGIVFLVLGHLVVAAVSMYALARQHGLSHPACALSALAFVFSAPMCTRAIGHWFYLHVAAWLPLLLLLVRAGLDARTLRVRARMGLGAGVVLGLAVLGGAPPVLVLMGVTLGLYWLFYRCTGMGQETGVQHVKDGADARPPRPGKRKRRKRVRYAEADGARLRRLDRFLVCLARDGGMFLLIGVIGLLVAMPLMLPALELANLSARGADNSALLEIPRDASTTWGTLRSLVVYSGDAGYESLRASGAGVLLVACFAALTRRKHALLHGLLFLALLDASRPNTLFFGHLVRFFAPYPVGDPGRAMVLACLPLGLLAGMGLDAFLDTEASHNSRVARTAAAGVLGMMLVIALLVWAYPHPFMKTSVWVVAAPALLATVLVTGNWFGKPALWKTGAVALAFIEVLAWNRSLLPHFVSGDSRMPMAVSELDGTRELRNTNRRGTEFRANVNMYKLEPIMNGFDPLQLDAMRQYLCAPEYEDLYLRMIWPREITSASVRGNLLLKRRFWLARQCVSGAMPGKDDLFPPTTTVFLQGAECSPAMEVKRSDVPHRAVSDQVRRETLWDRESPAVVLRAKGPLDVPCGSIEAPRLHSTLVLLVSADVDAVVVPEFFDESGHQELGRYVSVTGNGQPAYHEVPLSDLRPLRMNLSAKFAPNAQGMVRIHEAVTLSDLKDEEAMIRVVSSGANHAEVSVGDLKEERLLVFLEAAYPGWSATVDGEKAPVLKANDVFQAVRVPSGTHVVRFRFVSWRVYAGMAIGICALLAVALALVLLRPRRSGEEPGLAPE